MQEEVEKIEEQVEEGELVNLEEEQPQANSEVVEETKD